MAGSSGRDHEDGVFISLVRWLTADVFLWSQGFVWKQACHSKLEEKNTVGDLTSNEWLT